MKSMARKLFLFCALIMAITSLFVITASAESKQFGIASITSDDQGCSIMTSDDRTHRYVNIKFDNTMTTNSSNSQMAMNGHGMSVRDNLYIDGMSVMEWIEYGEGDQYQVMVHFSNDTLALWFDVTREPGMTTDEAHWIEFREGLITPDGDTIVPAKLYFDPETKKFEQVDSFDGLKKPWMVEQMEKTTAPPETSDTEPETSDTEPETSETEPANTTPTQMDSTTVPTTASTSGSSSAPASTDDQADGFPVWAIVVIVIAAVAVIGIVVVIIIKKRVPAQENKS